MSISTIGLIGLIHFDTATVQKCNPTGGLEYSKCPGNPMGSPRSSARVQASLPQGVARIGAELLRSDARGRGTADIGSPRASNVARDTKARSNALHGIPKFYGNLWSMWRWVSGKKMLKLSKSGISGVARSEVPCRLEHQT